MRKLNRKWTILVIVISLVFGLLPPLTVQAAPSTPGTPGFFIPDNNALKKVANLSEPLVLDRSNVYISTSENLSITGTYALVSSDTMSVTVEMMENVNGAWNPVPQKAFNAGVRALDSNRFEVLNLKLFPGYNKITFKGFQGTVEKKDVFYVLYDNAPVLKSLKVGSGADPVVNFNEGAQIVVKSNTVYLEGVAANTTKISVNGLSVTPLLDGTFFAPALTLNPGRNDIKIVLENPSNKFEVYRTIYYYDATQPFIDVKLNHDSASYGLLNQKPTSTGAATTVNLTVEMLVPYNSTAFQGLATVQTLVYGGTSAAGVNGAVSDRIIYDNSGVTPTYRLVKFTTADVTLKTTGATIDKDQKINLTVNYGTFSVSKDFEFTVLSNELYIKEIYLLPNHSGAGDVGNKVKLSGSDVPSDTFYIVVETNKAVTSEALSAVLMPFGTTQLTVTEATYITGLGSNERAYKVENLPSGAQKVEFKYSGTSSSYLADINFVSSYYIYVDNVYDGQYMTVNGADAIPDKLTITGQFVGFKGALDPDGSGPAAPTNAEFYINSNKTDKFKFLDPKEDNKFSGTLDIGPSGDLYFGENRLVFRAKYLDAPNNIERVVEKTIRLYITDTNVPQIDRFQPIIIPSGARESLSGLLGLTGAAYDAKLAKIFIPSTDIQFTNNRYVTSLKKYDLAFMGSNAYDITLRLGGEIIFQVDGASGNVTNSKAASWERDVAGGAFIYRLNQLEFTAPGTHVFTLELRGPNGVKISQSLELVREVAPYRIIAPKPTVGDRYIVNKNFILFDIEAEGATEVLIDGEAATKRPDKTDRFVYEYVGLKPDKETDIKIVVKQPNKTYNDSIKVFYTNSVEIGAQYMQQLSTKHNVFNNNLQLTFPKGTVLKQNNPILGYPQYYDKTKLLFGIADPENGSVEKVNDYGNVIGRDPDERRTDGGYTFIVDRTVVPFRSELNRQNFTRISPIYWISGGLGEQGTKGSSDYRPATNGVTPYPYNVEMSFIDFPEHRKLVPTNRGELTLKFDESVVDEAGTTITVFFFNDNGEWVNLGGKVDTKKNTVTVPFDDFGFYMVTKLRYGFNDITNHGWARNVLEAMFAKGFMKNLRFDDFGADDYISRGEFATLLVKALSLPLKYDNNQSFLDVVPTSRGPTWDYAHIETAARAGIITGLQNRVFGPEQRLTREQAAVMIARALELKTSINDDKLQEKLQKTFTDEISYYARPAVEAVFKAGIMEGIPNELSGEDNKKTTIRFEGQGNLTRAQAAQIAVRLMQRPSIGLFPKNFN